MTTAQDYLKQGSLPLFWCPGCGNGVVLSSLLRAFARQGVPRERIVIVTGIGCFGKADDYIDTCAVHGTHGRALPIATGVKAHNPDLVVVALMGDGDCATIGGNHLIHAARRNIGVVAVVANNRNYGMTGGQSSATTPAGAVSTTSAYGNPEHEFDLCQLALAAGASFVARSTVFHARQTERLLASALEHRGFSLVEVMSSCPVYYGRFNGLPTPVAMMEHWRDSAVPVDADAELRAGQFRIGVLGRSERPEFTDMYRELRVRAQAGARGADTGSLR